MSAALETVDLRKNFGALPVSRNVNLRFEAGMRHALIGPNGAGKTTLVNLITGALKADSGRVLMAGRDITGLAEAARVKRGLARTFQINQLFREMTVLENVVLSVSERRGVAGSFWRGVSRDRDVIDEAAALLEQLRLEGDALTPIKALPYGLQRLVEIAITLAQRPRVLLLDEPAAGVPLAESHIILDAIDALADDIAVLIIEHDMDIVFRFADVITVLVAGSVLTQGAPEDVARDERVKAVYLGEGRYD